AEGKKMYIQERVREQADRFLTLLEQPNTYVYICGLRGMESGILEALEQASAAQGKNWPALFEDVKAQKRWRVEVY
ncbi:MAG: ferredoxin-NADP reductase, partial [Cyanobacteria bacterium HKST-UBA05]|nr:ferredoxin-NADP reductase [Cyanobacteria bacterium HKST-UBA05]